MSLFLSSLLLSLLLWQASAQSGAPFDASPGCASRDDYEDNWRVLLDTRNYQNLISGSGAVWKERDIDGTGLGWVSVGGECSFRPRVCDSDDGPNQNNWVFTQYINYLIAVEVFVDVRLDISTCTPMSACTILQLNLHIFNRNGDDMGERVDRTNYEELSVLALPDGEDEGPILVRFDKTADTEGFYLAVQDVGTCATVGPFIVYYRVCPERSEGLVFYPEFGLPSTGSLTTNAVCANGSSPTSSLQLTGYSNGTCAGTPACACDPGYEFINGSEGPGCRACPIGMYKATHSNDDPCRTCPDFSSSTSPATAVCECDMCGFSRPPGEPDQPCSRVPSSPRVATNVPPPVMGNAVFLTWLAANDTGGRDDFHYNIYILGNDSGIFVKWNDNPIIDTSYTITDLDVSSSYSIVLVSSNGATGDPDQFTDVSVVQDRFLLFFVVTGEEEFVAEEVCPSPTPQPPTVCPTPTSSDSEGLSKDEAVVVTFFVTAIATAVITALVVVAIAYLLHKLSDTPTRSRKSYSETPRTVEKTEMRDVAATRYVAKNGTTDATDGGESRRPPPPRPTPSPRPLAPPRPQARPTRT